MKKTILLSAILSVFTVLQSCNDGNQNTENTELDTNIEQTTEQQSQEMTGEQSTTELEDTDLVPSGTYTGTARIVDPQEEEVYLQVNDTTTLELYFSDETRITQNDQQVNFDALRQGQRLEVEVEREGESLNPQQVRILE